MWTTLWVVDSRGRVIELNLIHLIAVTVTVCPMLQLELVNIKLDGKTVLSLVLELLTPMVTSSVGWEFNFTINVASPPASVTALLVDSIVNPSGP